MYVYNRETFVLRETEEDCKDCSLLLLCMAGVGLKQAPHSIYFCQNCYSVQWWDDNPALAGAKCRHFCTNLKRGIFARRTKVTSEGYVLAAIDPDTSVHKTKHRYEVSTLCGEHIAKSGRYLDTAKGRKEYERRRDHLRTITSCTILLKVDGKEIQAPDLG